jgi:hypothetical protein
MKNLEILIICFTITLTSLPVYAQTNILVTPQGGVLPLQSLPPSLPSAPPSPSVIITPVGPYPSPPSPTAIPNPSGQNPLMPPNINGGAPYSVNSGGALTSTTGNITSQAQAEERAFRATLPGDIGRQNPGSGSPPSLTQADIDEQVRNHMRDWYNSRGIVSPVQ